MTPGSIALAVLLAGVPDTSPARALIEEAEVARVRGDESAAVPHLRRALEAARSSAVIADQATAAVGLLEITRSTTDFAVAEPLVGAALAEATPGTAAEARALRLLAAVQVFAGDLPASEWALRQAIEVGERALGRDHEWLALPRCDLGMRLLAAGRIAEAEEMLGRSLALDDAAEARRPHVTRRARQVPTLEVLGALMVSRGRPGDAEPLLRRALGLATREPRLAPADVGAVLNDLARLLVDKGETREGGRLAARAVEEYAQVRDVRHAELAEVLVTLAAVRVRTGEFPEAEALLRRGRRIAELEEARPVVKAAAAANLGALWLAQGRLAEAEPLLEQALELVETVVDEDHAGLIPAVQMLADCYRRRGRGAEAAALYERALGLAARAFGPRSPAALPSLSGLAGIQEQAGDTTRAEALRRDALAIAEESIDGHDAARAEALVELAAFYARHGGTGLAEHLYLRALAAVELTAARDPRRLAVLSGLASFYAAQGRRAEAARIERALGGPGSIAAAAGWVVPPAEHP